MVSQKITVKNMTGFHLRPAGILCKIAMNYKSKVQFQFNSVTANAKSVLSVLGACIKSGDEIEFVCTGEDEEDALKGVVAAVENGLGEEKTNQNIKYKKNVRERKEVKNESCIVSGRIWNQDQRGKSFKTEANGRDWRKTNPLAHHEILFSFWS